MIEVLVANRTLAHEAAAGRGESKGRKPRFRWTLAGRGVRGRTGDDHGESSPGARLWALDENCMMRR
ncbi:hypothetical protein [Rhodococcus maanshanensis]|uniref:hypothetical protein n=1 Tax=Rhodococcus maanshanensis TaxID=183556 RepID=UPI00093530CF|nr:hypothetical protein [Rhodococcus maanshanensis]